MISVIVIACTIAAMVQWSFSDIYPSPERRDNRPLMFVDADEGIVSFWFRLPNGTGRDLRVVDVVVDAPGMQVELIAVAATEDTSGGESIVRAGEPWQAGQSLPSVVPAGSDTRVMAVARMRPDCSSATLPVAPWGTVSATFDFGEGAFPSVSRTLAITESLWDGAGPFEFMGVRSDNPIARFCEELS